MTHDPGDERAIAKLRGPTHASNGHGTNVHAGTRSHPVASREALEARARSLIEANEALEAFSYVVSHDLKEPLRAMEFYLRALDEDHAGLPAPARRLVAKSREENRKLRALVEGLLELSRATRLDFSDVAAVNVASALECDACLARYEHLYRERGVRLESHPDAPDVLATMPALCQILGNLLVNAVKHNARPAPRVAVSARVRADDPTLVEILVEDNGPGFDPALVERFRAGTTSNPLPGGGFGLAIVARAVERLGGSMWLGSSESLGGAAVRFTLQRVGRPSELVRP